MHFLSKLKFCSLCHERSHIKVVQIVVQANRLTELNGISSLTELTELHISDQGIESLSELTHLVNAYFL